MNTREKLRPQDLGWVRDKYREAIADTWPADRELLANIGSEDAFFATEDFSSTLLELDDGAVELPPPHDSSPRLLFGPWRHGLAVALIQTCVDGRDVYLQLSHAYGDEIVAVEIYAGDEHSVGARARLAFWILDNPDLMEKRPRDIRTRGEIRGRNKSKPDEPRTVTVVELRSTHRDNNAAVQAAERTYRSRWIVRGHWHNYWTGKRDGERVLKPRYVMPYVKGPDGAPLNLTEKVSKW